MSTTLDEKSYQAILNDVYHVSKNAMMAKHNLDKIHETLKNDHRIAYEYMKQNQTFLNSVEFGMNFEGGDLVTAVRKDLSRFSGGNSEVVKEYLNNKAFKENVFEGHKLREQVRREAIELEETFVKHRFPSEQLGVVAIIHKAEHDLYNIFDGPEKIDTELRQELAALVRHEPFQKGKEEVERDRQALQEQKQKQHYQKVLRTVTNLSNKTLKGKEALDSIDETLKNDERINYPYMKQMENFLDRIESGQDVDFKEVKGDLLRFSKGNEALVTEYENNQEFREKVDFASETYHELYEDRIEFINSFDDENEPAHSEKSINDNQVARLMSNQIKYYQYDPSEPDFDWKFKFDYRLFKEPDPEYVDYQRSANRQKWEEERGKVVSNSPFYSYHKNFVQGNNQELNNDVTSIYKELRARKFDVDSPEFRKVEAKLLTGKYSKDYIEFEKQVTFDLEPIHPSLDRSRGLDRETYLYDHEQFSDSLSNKEGKLNALREGMERNIDSIEQEIKGTSISENEGFKKIFEHVKSGAYEGENEIESYFKMYDVPKLTPGSMMKLKFINHQAYTIEKLTPKVEQERGFKDLKESNDLLNRKMQELLDKVATLEKENNQLKQEQERYVLSEKGIEVIDFKEFDNRTEYTKKMHQEEGFVEAIGDSVIELKLHLEQYHECLIKEDLEQADWNIQEIKFHLSGLGHDVESSGFKEIDLKLRSGSYPNDKQEFYSNFLNDTKQVRLTRDHAQLIQEKEETKPKRTQVGLEL